ncbi:hypothetical protein F5Y03DRAFT_405931 [Xylaria venustula]|nr:hypothetical protein F5Y03DRAFT_405931 [Xylaria venustula]
MPVQNTFSIIPDAPAAINATRHGDTGDGTSARPSRPPMTTKQVKKAYQKANKGPKLSKAEQRRQELFEQDRIRKEFEKEKNQARARAARDRKKEKEERERAEKKKKGLPLIDVRASQDTIARFVRAKPKDRKRDHKASQSLAAGGGCKEEKGLRSVSLKQGDSGYLDKVRQFDDSDKENARPHGEFESHYPLSNSPVDEAPAMDHIEPLNKKRKLDVLDEEEEEDESPFNITHEVAAPSPKPNRKTSIDGDQMKGASDSNTGQSRLDLDDSFSTIDLSEDDLLDDLLCKTEKPREAPNTSNKRITDQQKGQIPQIESSQPKSPEEKNDVSSSKNIEKTPGLERIVGLAISPPSPRQIVSSSKLAPNTTIKTPHRSSIPEQAKQISSPHSATIPPTSSIRKSQMIPPSSRSFRHPRTPMAPPPIPPKFRPSKQAPNSHPRTPQFLRPSLPPMLPSPRTAAKGSCRPRITKPELVYENKLPPSTQLFLLSHFDDFLPTPSQEVREIFEEPKREHFKNESETQLVGAPIGHNASRPSPYNSKPSSVSCSRSVIPPPFKPVPRHVQQLADTSKPRKTAPKPSIQPKPQDTATTFDMPFFSTQDLLLSSQDVKDIEENPLPPPRTRTPTPIPPKDCSEPQEQKEIPQRSPKRKRILTSASSELRYKYLFQQQKSAQWEGPEARRKAREALDQYQAEEAARPEKLLAEGKEEQQGTRAIGSSATQPETANKGSQSSQSRGLQTLQARQSHPPGFKTPEKDVANSMPISGSMKDSAVPAVQNHASKLPRSKPGSSTGSNGKSQRTASSRPKSSYETMLELLAVSKGSAPPPPPPQKQRSSDAGNISEEQKQRQHQVGVDRKNEDGEKRQTTTVVDIPLAKEDGGSWGAGATTTNIPAASQETEYDWDDDDLLCSKIKNGWNRY